MNTFEAEKNLRYIKEMIEKTKGKASKYWSFFLVWGFLIIFAIIGMHILAFLEKFSFIWINWIVFMGIGVVYCIIQGTKEKEEIRHKTFAQQAFMHVAFSGGMAFLLTGFVFPLLKLYHVGVIPVLMSTIAGILFFTIGGILKWNYMKWCGVLCFVGSIVMNFVHWHFRSLFFIPLIIIGYLIPGFFLRSKYKKEKD